MKQALLYTVFILLFLTGNTQPITLIPSGASWKYLDKGTNQGTAWRATAFNDASWASGNAQLGYGDGDEATVISYGGKASKKYITSYFRRALTVSNTSAYTSLTLSLKRDDGAVVYLNGTEVVRSNMPTGTISYTTPASSAIDAASETTFYTFTVSTSLLVTGTNVIAVEVHQANATSTDLSFDLKLDATPVVACATPTGLSTTAITISTATLNWGAVSGATSYNIQYRKVGTATWTSTTASTNSKSISALTASTGYEWQVQTVCAAANSVYSASANFTTLTPCATPSLLSSSAITTSSATLNWGAVSGATGYNIQYRKTGAATWTSTTASTNSKSISALSAATTYEWQVQGICAAGNTAFSSPANFTTLTAPTGPDTLIQANSAWKYLDNGTNQGTAWRASSFNDSAWASGNAELGYGDGGEATVLSYGPNSSAKYITTYFRKRFSVNNPAAYTALALKVVRDDGIVVYINGVEVYRNNMPTGTIGYTTLSPVAIGGTDESAWTTAGLSPSVLVAGHNVIAVEIHQQAASSTDVSFNLLLASTTQVIAPVVTRGAYLQKLSPTSVTLRWRTDIACNSQVQFGTTTGYGTTVPDAAAVTEHVVTVSGLTPATKYYYTIGTTTNVLQGDTNNTFTTAPATGSTTPVRIWAIGDFGNGSTMQDNVRNAYMNYPGAYSTNVWLWLGDNAYETGTDAEFQSKVFNKYPLQFKRFPNFPSPGNHDYAGAGYQGSSTLTTNFPYFNIFSVPQAGECGGVASNSPKYYSYNYGNIHFISLDSYGALNAQGSPMYTWLSNDLAANQQRWIIVYFHHPPYTKGTHDSDTDKESKDMRTNIIPLLESYNVDLVLSGHSHMNERSYLIKGHYGLSGTFNSTMKVNTETNTFTKSTAGTVYAVCGTSGQANGTPQVGYPMPCMYFGDKVNNCSVVIDVADNLLSCKYLAATGSVVDQFSITKTAQSLASRETVTDIAEPGTDAQPSLTAFYATDENTIYLDYELKDQTNVTVELWNMVGQRVHSFKDVQAQQPAGVYRQELSLSNVATPSGTYLLSIRLNDKTVVKKLMIVG